MIVLVGLPARGKSYISHRLVNYLTWVGVRCRLFNVGAFRRQQLRGQPKDKTNRADFFNAANKDASAKREELASAVLEQLLTWLCVEGGEVAIFDATNTSKQRRKMLLDRVLREPGVEVLFVESICTDQKVLETNLAEKVRLSPDFKGMDFHAAVKDLKARIANYEAVYETIEDTEKDGKGNDISFIKVINLSSKIIANQIHGGLPRSILTFLMNLHNIQRPIFLIRVPDWVGGGDQAKDHSASAVLPGKDGAGGGGEGRVVDESLVVDCFGDALRRRNSGDFQAEDAPALPKVHFSEERRAALQLAGEVSITVQRRGDLTSRASVLFATADGSAQAGVHYQQHSGTLVFEELQTRKDIKIRILPPPALRLDDDGARPAAPPPHAAAEPDAPELSFTVTLSCPEAAAVTLGRGTVCRVTVLNDQAALPERVRMDWSRLRFPDVSCRRRHLSPRGREAVERISGVVAEQVEAFYKQQHKERMLKQSIVRDLIIGRLKEAKAELEAASVRRGVVEEALRLQERIAAAALVDRNYSVRYMLPTPPTHPTNPSPTESRPFSPLRFTRPGKSELALPPGAACLARAALGA